MNMRENILKWAKIDKMEEILTDKQNKTKTNNNNLKSWKFYSKNPEISGI